MTPDEITVGLHVAMDAAYGLPADDIDNVEGLIVAGERLVAFETLVTQLDEYDVVVPADAVAQLHAVASAVGASERFTRLLPPLT